MYNEEKSYHLLGQGRGAATRVAAREHTIHMDVPKSMGGKDSAPQPVELMLAALMVSVYVQKGSEWIVHNNLLNASLHLYSIPRCNTTDACVHTTCLFDM